jgi:transcriptional regulator with XRE-family HTH domain
MKPDQALQLGRVLKARREARGLSTHRLARATEMDQATIVRLEAGSIVAPRPDKLSRLAQALGISGADVFAMADYTVPADLPSLRPYLHTRYRGLLAEDIDKIEAYVGRLAKKRGFDLAEPVPDSAGSHNG